MTLRAHAFWALLCFILVEGCTSTALPPIGTTSTPFTRESDEKRLFEDSRRFEASLEKSRALSYDTALEAYLTQVADGLLTQEVRATGVKVRVRVIRLLLPPNAFVLPDGTIYVHSRMLVVMENEAQLAAILGHELVHFINRHLVKERREARSKAALSAALSSMLPVTPLTGEVAELFSLAAIRGYSGERETEADIVGFKLVVQAGYDPAEVLKIFEALQREAPPGQSEGFFFATHPRLKERINSTRELLLSGYASRDPEAVRRVGREEFERAISDLLLENASMELRSGRFQEAKRSIERHLAANPMSPRGHFLRGEWWRLSGDGDHEAIQAYENAVQYDARFPEPRRELGLLLRTRGEREAARAQLQRYLELAPQAPDATIIRGYLNALSK